MTALEIIKALKANKNGSLWVNETCRQAAYLPGDGHDHVAVDYNAAKIAKGDPAIAVLQTIDGAVYAAA